MLAYRQALKAARSFTDINYRDYFIRVVQRDWRSGNLNDPTFLGARLDQAQVIRRQAMIDQAYTL